MRGRWETILERERARLFKSTGQGDLYGTPTNLSIRQIVAEVGVTGSALVIDLGSGTGNFLFVLEELLPTAKFAGIEFRQDWFEESALRAKEFQSAINFRCGNILDVESFAEFLPGSGIDCVFVFAFDVGFPPNVRAKVKQLYESYPGNIVFVSCWSPHYYGGLNGAQLNARVRIGVLGPEGIELEPGYSTSVSYLDENYTPHANEAREEKELADFRSRRCLDADPDKQIEEFLIWKYSK